jgi:hypothetical protein
LTGARKIERGRSRRSILTRGLDGELAGCNARRQLILAPLLLLEGRLVRAIATATGGGAATEQAMAANGSGRRETEMAGTRTDEVE